VLNWVITPIEAAMALVLMAVVSALLLSLSLGPLPPELDPITRAMLTSPMYLALVQVVGMFALAVSLHLLGRFAKGRGTWPQAILLMAWLEALLIALSVVQVIGVLLLPILGLVLFPLGIVLSVWWVVSFVAELHGFQSFFLTLLGVIAAFVAAVFGMVVVFVFLFALGVLHV